MKTTIYGAEWCGSCKVAKKYLEDNNVEFNYLDIETDNVSVDKLAENSGGMGLPVIQINDKFILGFDKLKINETLGI